MKVILLGELRGKGGEGDIVEVAQGYAENFLFPQRIAQPATPGNIKQLEERRHVIAKREEKRIADANAAKEQLDGKNVKIEAKVGENNQLFGSVTPAQIADAIKEQLGVEVDRKRIVRGNAIKTAGTHNIEVNFYRDINAVVSVMKSNTTAELGGKATARKGSVNVLATGKRDVSTIAASLGYMLWANAATGVNMFTSSNVSRPEMRSVIITSFTSKPAR